MAIKCLCFLALCRGIAAIQESLRIVQKHDRQEPAPFRQTLENQQDSMYIADLTVGGQQFKGILDTGSFELVIFGRNCRTCGIARAYNEKLSATYRPGMEHKELAYGSGACLTNDGRDTVDIAGMEAKSQAFWLAFQCQMPLLRAAPFQAIVGIGPPGQPLFMAEEMLAELKSQEAPQDVLMKAAHEVQIAKGKTDLIEKFGVQVFSTCFGRDPGSPGYLIWNDAKPTDQPGLVTAHVPGKITWSVEVKGASFKPPLGGDMIDIACKEGCAAIVDTGTTLLGLDTESYEGIFRYVSRLGKDCSDLSHYPDLHFKIGDGEVVLPPSSYIGEVFGLASDTMGKLMHTERPSPFQNASRLHETGQTVMCQLLVMDMGSLQTPFGPEIILGMSTFREYYVTFDLGTGRDDRSIFFSPANDQCAPMSAEEVALRGDRDKQLGFRTDGGLAVRPNKMDISTFREPRSLDGNL